MRADATGTNAVEARKALGAGLVVSVLASVLFAVATVPLVTAGAAWGFVAGSIALAIISGVVATIDAALLVDRKPATASVDSPFDVAA